MTLDDLPEWVTTDFLASRGFTPDDVRRSCPWAVEHGPAHDPYWHRDDVASLMGEAGRRGDP